jgi:hypothetical protein
MPAIASTWRKFLDGFYYFREWLTTLITYLSLHIYASEISWNEIKNGKIRSTQKVGLKLEDAKDLDLLLSEVKCRLAEEEDRRNSTTDKCKSLVTLSSLVLAASGIVVSKTNFDATWTQLILLLAALSLLHVVVLISMHFAVGTDKHPKIDQHDATLSGEDLRKSLINIYLQCQADRNARVNFLVELYKGARFYFLLGLTLIIVLLVSTFPARPKEDLPSTVAKQLTENATFIERLSDRIAKPENNQTAPAIIPPAIPDSSPSKPKSDSTAKPTAEPPTTVVPLIADSPTTPVAPTTAAPPTSANPPPPSEPTPPADESRKTTDQPGNKPQAPPAPADEANKTLGQQEGKPQTPPPTTTPIK